jgi:hypothetical protein
VQHTLICNPTAHIIQDNLKIDQLVVRKWEAHTSLAALFRCGGAFVQDSEDDFAARMKAKFESGGASNSVTLPK